jgi:hypothetical protein
VTIRTLEFLHIYFGEPGKEDQSKEKANGYQLNFSASKERSLLERASLIAGMASANTRRVRGRGLPGARLRLGGSGLGRFIRRSEDGRCSFVECRGGRIEKSRIRQDLGVWGGIGVEGEFGGRFDRVMDGNQDRRLALGAEGVGQVDRIFTRTENLTDTRVAGERTLMSFPATGTFVVLLARTSGYPDSLATIAAEFDSNRIGETEIGGNGGRSGRSLSRLDCRARFAVGLFGHLT